MQMQAIRLHQLTRLGTNQVAHHTLLKDSLTVHPHMNLDMHIHTHKCAKSTKISPTFWAYFIKQFGAVLPGSSHQLSLPTGVVLCEESDIVHHTCMQ